jgi:hypothetical protein
MRAVVTAAVLLLCGTVMLEDAQAQERPDLGEFGRTTQQTTAPRVGPESERTEVGAPQTRRRGAAEDENGEIEENGRQAQAEVEMPLHHVELPDVSLDDVVRAAHVTAHANTVYAEHRDAIMRALLDGDEQEYASLKQLVESETAAAAEEAGLDMETYTEVMRSVQRHAVVSQRFFAALEQTER